LKIKIIQFFFKFETLNLGYDATVVFCDRWIGRRSRTHDQMVQAARSGKQNIAEGSMASGTSKKFEDTPVLQRSEGFRAKASRVKL
jgi:hypothetical protein